MNIPKCEIGARRVILVQRGTCRTGVARDIVQDDESLKLEPELDLLRRRQRVLHHLVQDHVGILVAVHEDLKATDLEGQLMMAVIGAPRALTR